MPFSARMQFTRILIALAFAIAATFASAPSQAQQRFVVVNGQFLSAEQLYVLDQLAGGYVPNGAYWVDPSTGVWGYAGDPTPRGQIGGAAAGQSGGTSYSGALDRGPFGTYMSDGNCSFVNGVPVGNC